MENERYLNNLIEQFKAATGVKTVDTNSKEFMKEFREWLSKRQVMGDGYIALLNYMELYFDTPHCAEIGKGRYDSVVLPYETTIITPYSDGIIRVNDGEVINSDFNVFVGAPLLTSNEMDFRVIQPHQISTYMTQNPYSSDAIRCWHQLHCNHNNAIILGVYGKTYDKDMETKINQLKKLRAKLFDNYVEDYALGGDNYWYALATDTKAKKLVK